MSGTSAHIIDSFNGKENVLHVSPNGSTYSWALLSYDLTEFDGQNVDISFSMQVWLDTATGIAWQLNTAGYPTIAGQPTGTFPAGSWRTIEGTSNRTLIQDTAGGADNILLYLSRQQIGTVPAYIADLTLMINGVTIAGGNNDSDTITLTIGDKRDLNPLLPNTMTDIINWSSSAPTVVRVTNTGIAEALTFTSGGGNTFVSGAATGTATITATAADNSKYDFTVIATTAAQVDSQNLPPLKDHFAAHFPLIGNIYNPGDTAVNGSAVTNSRLTRHFNILTAENDMKPSYLAPDNRRGNSGLDRYNFTTADRMVNAARASGFQVVGHTLLWHSQNATWMNNMATANSAVALAEMKEYITDVMSHFKNRIHTWDILNEVFPDGGYTTGSDWKAVMRQENPWYKAIGSDFVYEGFLAARLADPNSILYYNDFNTDIVAKATMIRNMVQDVNNQYLALPDAQKPEDERTGGLNEGRLLIEGIGMQEHHNQGVQASAVRATLFMFNNMTFAGSNRKIKISVSELDVIAQTWGEYSGNTAANTAANSTVTNQQLITQANLYRDYMLVYLDYKAIIERISIWGVTDNQSWRAKGLPLLFDHMGRAKPAYYRFVSTVTN